MGGRHISFVVTALIPEASSPVRALAGDTLLCSWARHLTPAVPFSNQEYKWVPVNYWGNVINWRAVTCNELASHPGGEEILLATSKINSGSYEPFGSKASHNYNCNSCVIVHCVLVKKNISVHGRKKTQVWLPRASKICFWASDTLWEFGGLLGRWM